MIEMFHRTLCACSTILLIVSISAGINITDCGSQGELNNFNYSGCRNSSEDACHVVRGTNGTLNVEFTPAEQAFALTVKAYGIVGGIEMPLMLQNPDACLEDNITCPIPANANQTYSTDLHIVESLPQISAEVRWQIQDQTDTNIICVQFPVEIC